MKSSEIEFFGQCWQFITGTTHNLLWRITQICMWFLTKSKFVEHPQVLLLWSRMGIDGTLIWKSIDQETLRFLKKNVTHSAETFFWWIYKLTLSFIEVSRLFNWIEKATVDVTEYDSPGYIRYWITSDRCSLFCEYNDSTFVFPMCN